ncbi:hypothetical protein BGZ61DRAFT_537365 [Ilyonectria robusta]|uniref:uncharacterized protein n=1 Tax=Ilyonectria robusta TaxID=1079257 RepID=UPI001E8DB34E|nr:uncharacterized protein BGZ61DRAFT_537365 [Ilyonectria robusta]KAH8670729.1 hypothetical protein BGZ61DRAFT_537365 [Ilyonectria robusta]
MMQNVLLSTFLCQLFAVLAFAAPIADDTLSTTGHDNLGYGTGGGIIGLVILILDIIVVVEVLKSNRPPASKLLWCLVIFLFPLVGMVIYYLFSNRGAHNSGSYEVLP